MDYLKDTDNLNDLRYIFNGQKADITVVKNAFKELFTQKADEIFDIILNNQQLRNDLFRDNMLSPKQQFNQLTNNTNSLLYRFLKAD